MQSPDECFLMAVIGHGKIHFTCIIILHHHFRLSSIFFRMQALLWLEETVPEVRTTPLTPLTPLTRTCTLS